MNCSDLHCRFKTPHAHRMELHVANTGHGKKIHESRAHLSIGGGQKKNGSDPTNVDGKGKGGKKSHR